MEKRWHSWRPLLALGCALGLLLAGCGVSAAGGTVDTSSSANKPATATATATATGATSSVVTLSIGATQYSTAGRIAVTIRNGGSATIFAQQHNTSCSMILLERFANGAWQPVFPCANGFPHPTLGHVSAGRSAVVQLVPVVTGDAEVTGGIQWQAGTYRALLRYTTTGMTSFSQGTTVYSTTFAVA